MVSRGIPLDSAAIVSTILEAVLYGFSLLMFCGTARVLLFPPANQKINYLMMIVACSLFVFSTMHILIDIIRLEEGFVRQRDSFPGGPIAFFAEVSQKTFISKNAIYELQALLGDAFLIHRCYMVWQSFMVIVVPIILWCGAFVSGVGCIYSVSRATVNAGDVFVKETGQWIISWFALALSTNILSTGLLAYRIWSVNRQVATYRYHQSTLSPVLRVIVDSGLLYSLTLISCLLCFIFQSNGQYIVLDTIMPITSIAFYMIILRLSAVFPKQSPSNNSSRNQAQAQESLRMRPLEIHITQLTESSKGSQPRNDKADGSSDSPSQWENHDMV